MSERWTTEEMMKLAESGVAKVDRLGPRGASMVNFEEITAMAAVISILAARLRAVETRPAQGQGGRTNG